MTFGIAPSEYTNIKGLPDQTKDRMYFTEIGYSQSYPWVEISRSPSGKTVTLAKVNVSKDPDWTPNIHSGGFSGHCDNQSEQTWIFESINENFTVKIRKTKNGWINKGVKFIEGRGSYFYDYNF